MKHLTQPSEEPGSGRDVKDTNMLNPNAVDRFKDGQNSLKPHTTKGGAPKGKLGAKGQPS